MRIQPIVEGHGEVEAVPVLLRRFRDLAQTYPLEVNAPMEPVPPATALPRAPRAQHGGPTSALAGRCC
jgi:hypothetical protein